MTSLNWFRSSAAWYCYIFVPSSSRACWHFNRRFIWTNTVSPQLEGKYQYRKIFSLKAKIYCVYFLKIYDNSCSPKICGNIDEIGEVFNFRNSSSCNTSDSYIMWSHSFSAPRPRLRRCKKSEVHRAAMLSRLIPGGQLQHPNRKSSMPLSVGEVRRISIWRERSSPSPSHHHHEDHHELETITSPLPLSSLRRKTMSNLLRGRSTWIEIMNCSHKNISFVAHWLFWKKDTHTQTSLNHNAWCKTLYAEIGINNSDVLISNKDIIST